MSTALGNYKMADYERELQFTMSDEDRTTLDAMRQENASNIAADKWHGFHIPLSICCGSHATAAKVHGILLKYSNSMKGRLIVEVAK